MNQQNNNNQVTLPRRSRRLATIIPASHWISIGYSEDDAQLMEKLQNDMKKYCDGSDKNILLRGRNSPILPHHDMMLPHWQKLFKALSGRTSETFDVNVGGICIHRPVQDFMFSALQSMNLSSLVLCNVELGNEGLLRLAAFLGENTSMKKMVLGGETIDDLSIASALSDAWKIHSSLYTIGLVGCGLNNIPILEKILEGCTTMKHLSISLDDLGSDGVGVISDFIRCNNPMKSLDLKYNIISDNDTVLLASVLKKNTNLRQFDLKNNDITEEGEKNLLRALYDPTSMNSIVESNHTCIPHTYDITDHSIVAQRPLLEVDVFYTNMMEGYSAGQRIRQKVVLALCGLDGELFDLSRFNDISLKLMPPVLELIQQHTAIRRSRNTPVQLEKDALSRLFHTLRGWELPLLFENLNSPSTDVTSGRRKRRKTRR